MKRAVKAFSLTLLLIIFSGCAGKEPVIITKTEFKEVLMPIKCIDKMPNKPKYDPSEPKSAKELMEYFRQCEEILKRCSSE